MGRATETDIERIDKELIKAQEAFVRADRRNDFAGATEQYLRMEALFDQRAHLPLQRRASE